MRMNLVVLVVCSVAILYSTEGRTADQIQVEAPVTTKLAGTSAPAALPSVLRVVCTKDSTVGTGFFHKSGAVISAEHVVSPCEGKHLLLILPSGEKVAVESAIVDAKRDLAILKPKLALQLRSLPISTAPSLAIGDQVAAWGFPSGYGGLRPLLTVGYLAGEDRPGPEGSAKQWVINAAFNLGNSGGPVVRLEDGTVVGVVSSKLAPLPASIEAAIKGLSEATYGLQFTKQEPGKEPIKASEAQVVAEVLKHLRSQTQLVLGFAVKLGDLRDFLKENSIDP